MNSGCNFGEYLVLYNVISYSVLVPLKCDLSSSSRNLEAGASLMVRLVENSMLFTAEDLVRSLFRN